MGGLKIEGPLYTHHNMYLLNSLGIIYPDTPYKDGDYVINQFPAISLSSGPHLALFRADQ